MGTAASLQDGNIILIGMPAVGKSTIGVLLAKRVQKAFVDTDLVIQTAEDRTLQQIINDEGVPGFRRIEARHILALDVTNTVVATGGSVVYSPSAMNHLAAGGWVVFLDLNLAQLELRLNDLDRRGVIREPGQSIAAIYAERHPLYRQFAHLTIACDNRSPAQIKEIIAAELASC